MEKNNYLNILLLMMALLMSATATAYDFEVDGIYYNIIGNNVAVTCKEYSNYNIYSDYSGDVTIPEVVTYNGNTYSVTEIGRYAFFCCTGLTSITLHNSIIGIGNCAFSGCNGLTNITIPNSVYIIDENAFSDCTGLTSITLPNALTAIENNLFLRCTGLKSVTIPNSVKLIYKDAFNGCTGLTSITIPNSVTVIYEGAFSGCNGLTSINIGDSVIRIGNKAFFNCRNLNSIILPYTLENIGNSAFSNCENLTDVTCLAITPPTCPDGAFYPAYYMATLHVPERSVEAYKATMSWSNFLTIVGDASGGGSSTPTNRCDVNGDGEVNIADVNIVINAILVGD